MISEVAIADRKRQSGYTEKSPKCSICIYCEQINASHYRCKFAAFTPYQVSPDAYCEEFEQEDEFYNHDLFADEDEKNGDA